MNIILFDSGRKNLLPLSYTRPIAEFRCGILSLKEKWSQRSSGSKLSFLTEDYLSKKYETTYSNDNYYVEGNVLADDQLAEDLKKLEVDQELVDKNGYRIAFRSAEKLGFDEIGSWSSSSTLSLDYECIRLVYLWNIFSYNGQQIENDFELLTKGRESQKIDLSNTVFGDRIFLEEGAKVRASILNSESGPIYVGKNAEIMEGSVVRGGLAMCESSALKLAAKVYGPTTIGPHSKVGGEVNNSVIFGYSNKGHDGFLGNSVLGEWCNLGADTNVSNLKNNYAHIKVWNYEKGGFLDSGLQFCGLMMGDHSKAGINTMFNTATVVGVSANVFGGGFPRNFIPSFSWGGAEKWTHFRLSKALEVAEKMMERRKLPLSQLDIDILQHIEEVSKDYRNF